MSSRDDKIYYRCFQRKSYGFALFKQVPDERLRPGTCGYFDFDGDWHAVLQLIEKEEPIAVINSFQSMLNSALRLLLYLSSSALRLIQKEQTPEAVQAQQPTEAADQDAVTVAEEFSDFPELAELPESEEGPWGPIVSEGVRGSQIDFKVEGKAPDGTGAGLGWKYTSSREESAILVTDGKITHKQTEETDKIRAWMYQNLEKVIQRSGASDTIKKQGIWVVTKTYIAKSAAISVLQSKNSETYFGIKAVTHGVEASPSTQWWNGYKDTSWKVLEDENGVVLFMSGIWWGANPLNPFSKKMKAYEKRKDQKFLDAHDGVAPVTIEFKEKENQEGSKPHSEYVQFIPCAVGIDPSFRGIPAANKSPLAEPGDEGDEEDDDSTDDESEGEE